MLVVEGVGGGGGTTGGGGAIGRMCRVLLGQSITSLNTYIHVHVVSSQCFSTTSEKKLAESLGTKHGHAY